MTSIRRGFAGGGFAGKQSLPKKMAMAAGVPGADLIPDTSELFLGFTSTQKAGLGPRLIANHETLGFIDLRGGYFHGGTHMHLSHLDEDLEAWYLNFDFDERVLTTFRPGMTNVKQGTQTVAQGPKDVATQAETAAAFEQTGRFGHSASIQTTSRLLQDVVGPDGTRLSEGNRDPAARRLQHARQPVRLERGARARQDEARRRRRGCTSSSSTRRATTSRATGSRWTASCPTARSSTSVRAAARRASTRC